MTSAILASYFFGGVFAGNAIPHIVAGVSGHAFTTPFASPPGKGLSSSVVNVVWGFFNASVGYYLTLQVGDFDVRNVQHVGAFGAGAFILCAMMAKHFGTLYGGDLKLIKKN